MLMLIPSLGKEQSGQMKFIIYSSIFFLTQLLRIEEGVLVETLKGAHSKRI
jgi:hypothetical protein